MSAPSRDDGFAYLLGELQGPEAEALEAQMFEDDAVHEQLRALEAELVDDYGAGELLPEQRGRFEARYLTNPEGRARVATAAALKRLADDRPPPAVPVSERRSGWADLSAWLGARRWVFGPALAGAALLAVVVVSSGPDAGPEALGPLRLTLVPDVVRAVGSTATLALEPRPSEIDLELALDGASVGSEAQVRLRRGGRLIERLRPSRIDEVAVQVRLRAQDLEPGGYVVELWSGTGADAALVATYAFRAESTRGP